MADKLTHVEGSGQTEGCGDADTALAPARHTRAPTSGGLAEKISTRVPADASALPGSGIKQAGIREWWGNFWNGVSVAAKIMTESVTVTAQVAGSPTAYVREFKDKAGNVVFSITIDTTKTLFTFYDQVTAATSQFLPQLTYDGTVGSWWVQTINAVQGFYNRGWASASGVPAFVHRVFADAVAADVIAAWQDDGTSGTPKDQIKFFGDGSTEKGANLGSGGGLFEYPVANTYADGAAHYLWTGPVLAVKTIEMVDAEVLAEKSDGTLAAAFHIRGRFRRETAGNVYQWGVTDYLGTAPENFPFYACSFNPDTAGQTVRIAVQDTTAGTVTWKAAIRRIKITTG